MQLYTIILKGMILPIADKVMDTRVSYYLNLIKRMNTWTKEDIKNWQIKKLRNLINHAYLNTEYYRNLFKELELTPADICNIDDLSKLPSLSKETIKDNFEKLIPKNIRKINYKLTSTGGSTGTPLQYYIDNNSWSFSNANQIYNWEKVGYKYGNKYIALGSTSLTINEKVSLKHKIYYKLKNKIGLNGINMSNEICQDYIERIKKGNIRFIYGYASSIYLLAKYVISSNSKLEIDACFPTSEILTTKYKETIREAFNCKILNGYGANDGGISAFEHNISHFEVGYNSIVRFQNDNQFKISPALLTDLLNYAMPLINYNVGDELLMKKNTNNYNGQVIENVMGRTSDHIKFENGRIITGPGFTVLFGKLPVEYYYIKKNGYNSLICQIKTNKDFLKEHENIIYSSLRNQCGSDIQIKITYSDEIHYTKNGKVKYFN